MSELLQTGCIVNGKVINVKPYGAFISIGHNKKGLLHISNVSNNFVNDINEFLHQGDEIKVKILSIDDTGKITLSLKEIVDNKISDKNFEKQKETSIEVTHKCMANVADRLSLNEKKQKTLEELLKDYNRQSNDKLADINRRLKR